MSIVLHNVFVFTTESKVTVEILQTDMPEELQTYAISRARHAVEEFKIEKDMATSIKRAFDEGPEDLPLEEKLTKGFGPTWHCIVGRNYGCSITHSTRYLLFFRLGQRTVLLFKSLE